MKVYQKRPYQEQLKQDMRAAARRTNAFITWLATGGGKTKIAGDVTADALAKNPDTRVLFVGDSTEIIDQTSETMTACDIAHGIIQGSRKGRNPWERVHIATVQTLRNRDLPLAHLVWADECHLSRGATWHRILTHYKNAGAKVIGLSATPRRLDGKGLGAIFDEIVYGPPISELTEMGYLVPTRIFCPPGPSAAGMKKVAGDFTKDEATRRMDKPALIGDAVEQYAKHALGRKGIVAASGIEHSKHLMAAFNAAGIPAAHCDGTTPRDERKKLLGEGGLLATGKVMILCQVDICGKGWDRPEVSYLGDCRMTLSLARWLQIVGRILRPFEGKTDAVILDHAGNMKDRFGFPDEARVWTLDDAVVMAGMQKRLRPQVTCPQCYMPYYAPGPKVCGECGAEMKCTDTRAMIGTVDVDLVEVKREKMIAVEKWRAAMTPDKKRIHYENLRQTGIDKDYSPKWASVKYHAVYQEWPPREWQVAPMTRRAVERGMDEVLEGLGV